MEQEVLEKLRDIIALYLDNPDEIGMESNIANELQINSVDFVNIIVEIEDVFQCHITEEQMSNIHLIKDFVQCILISKSKYLLYKNKY